MCQLVCQDKTQLINMRWLHVHIIMLQIAWGLKETYSKLFSIVLQLFNSIIHSYFIHWPYSTLAQFINISSTSPTSTTCILTNVHRIFITVSFLTQTLTIVLHSCLLCIFNFLCPAPPIRGTIPNIFRYQISYLILHHIYISTTLSCEHYMWCYS